MTMIEITQQLDYLPVTRTQGNTFLFGQSLGNRFIPLINMAEKALIIEFDTRKAFCDIVFHR